MIEMDVAPSEEMGVDVRIVIVRSQNRIERLVIFLHGYDSSFADLSQNLPNHISFSNISPESEAKIGNAGFYAGFIPGA